MTCQRIRLSTNFMTLIPSLTYNELGVVSMERLQRVWHASLPFRTPGSLFGDLLKYSFCWDQFFRICRVFSLLFISNTPRYFLDFALSVSWCFVAVARSSFAAHVDITVHVSGVLIADVAGQQAVLNIALTLKWCTYFHYSVDTSNNLVAVDRITKKWAVGA